MTGERDARRLSAEDLSILALENETVAGHMAKVIVLPGPVDLDLLRSSINSRLARAPELSLRLGEIDGEPWWIPDPRVDVRAHVVESERAGAGRGPIPDRGGGHLLPAPGPFATAVADRCDTAAGRGRQRAGLAYSPRPGGRDDRDADGQRGAVGRRACGRLPLAAPAPPAGRGRRGAADPAEQHRLAGLRAAAREMPQPWLRSPFNGHIDARRAVAFATVGLDELHEAATAADGATVNDAVLTVVAGGLRRWLEAHHGRLGAVRVKVPVSLHALPPAAGDDGREPGNRDSFFCLDLPLGSADPVERLAAIRQATRARKQGHDAQQLDALMRQLARTPRLRRFAERVLTHPRSFALNVSNVPGPRRPVQVLGMPVRALYSLAEIREHHVLRVSVISLANSLNFGLVADPTLLPDVDHLARDMQAEAGALTARLPAARPASAGA